MIPEVININFVTFSLIFAGFEVFFFDRRFADWPWNVVILLSFQVPVHILDVIFEICDTCRCEIT